MYIRNLHNIYLYIFFVITEIQEEPQAKEDLSNHEVIFLKSIVESPDFARKYGVSICGQE